MRKLIKLELRKNNIKPYVLSSIGLFIAVSCIGVLFSAIPIIEPGDPASHEFSDPAILITMISVTSMSMFAVLSSVMYSRFIIREYTGTQNTLLFTYPQKRSSIFLAKFILVFTFIFVSMFAVNILSVLVSSIISHLVGLRDEVFFSASLAIKLGLIFSLTANFIGLIALRVGFYKKSIIAPIITSIILITPFGNSVSLLGTNSLILFIIAATLFSLVSAILLTGLLKTVNNMECL